MIQVVAAGGGPEAGPGAAAGAAGPALRGLDPLPLREFQGKVQVTWIEYKFNSPQLIIQRVG